MTVAVFPIVEGHGEERAVPGLLNRIWSTLATQEELRVLQPFRLPRGKMTKDDDPDLPRALFLGRYKLKATAASRSIVSVILDADEDCLERTYPEGLGPLLASRCTQLASDLEVSVVAADQDYEAWLLAGDGDQLAEGRKGKPRFVKRLGRWSETVDLPSWTSRLDIEVARANSRSFDKLCREVERWIEPA